MLRLAIGKRLTELRRYVLGLGRSNDERGHGFTELVFGTYSIVVGPGPNEDYIVIEQGPLRALDPQYWTLVYTPNVEDWRRYLGAKLESIEVYTDGKEDVALLFTFEDRKAFSILLCDTDLIISEKLEEFENTPGETKPKLRIRIG